jgi:hypothetical protein
MLSGCFPVNYNRAMKPASRYFRWFLVASLSLSLVSGGMCISPAMADCPLNKQASKVQQHCCCGANCKCGPACCSDSAPKQSQQPTKGIDNELRDLVKITSTVSCMVCEHAFGQRFAKPTSILCVDLHDPQTLVTQHTCLQV